MNELLGRLTPLFHTLRTEKGNNTGLTLNRILHEIELYTGKSYYEDGLLGMIGRRPLETILTLLQHQDQEIRKTSICLLSLILSETNSKLYFIQKCGLAPLPGPITLNRLSSKDTSRLTEIVGKVKKMNSSVLRKDCLWVYSLKDDKIRIINKERMRKECPDLQMNVFGIWLFPQEIREGSKKYFKETGNIKKMSKYIPKSLQRGFSPNEKSSLNKSSLPSKTPSLTRSTQLKYSSFN